MDEGEYRGTYHEVNQRRCVFEKSILSRQTMCEHAHRFCLADREGVACQEDMSHALCETLLNNLRQNALFALKLTHLDGQLPHAKEVKVQTGGLLGLRKLLQTEDETSQEVNNIIGLIEQARQVSGDLNNLPYDQIARSIMQFEGRNQRTKRRK